MKILEGKRERETWREEKEKRSGEVPARTDWGRRDGNGGQK